MPTTYQWRTRPLPPPPLCRPTPFTGAHAQGFLGCSAPAQTTLTPPSPGNSSSNRAHFLVSVSVSVPGVWLLEPPPPNTHTHTHTHTHTLTHHQYLLSIFTKLHEALTFYSQAIRSYLECVTRAILHHLTDQEPPCKAGPGMSRYRFGEKREWGM